jgi:hypothetical protein
VVFDHPLDGARGKIVRATQHAVALREHCQRYTSGRPAVLSFAQSEQGQAVDILLESTEDPPPYLGAILGDIAHNLRSALDQLTWQLAVIGPRAAELDQPKVSRGIQFPITDSKAQFDGHHVLEFLGDDSQARIGRWQPFNNVEAGTHLVNPLAILRAISNTDKHRLLVPAVGKIALDDIRARSTVPLDVSQVEVFVDDAAHVGEGTILFRIPCSDPSGVTEVHLVSQPVPDFLIDGMGMLRLDQVFDLAEQISTVVEDVGQRFPTAEHFDLRTEGWLTPDLTL